jgi:hypothetical protein
MWLIGSCWPHCGLFRAAHDSRIEVGSLNRALLAAPSTTKAIEVDANALIFCVRFRGLADMAGTTAGLVPVENDPFETWATKHSCSAKALFIPLRTQRMSPTLGERADVFRSIG